MTKFYIGDASITALEGKVSRLVGKLGYIWYLKGQLWRLELHRDSSGGKGIPICLGARLYLKLGCGGEGLLAGCKHPAPLQRVFTAELCSAPLRERPSRAIRFSSAQLLPKMLLLLLLSAKGKESLQKCSDLLQLRQKGTFSAPPLREFPSRCNCFFWFFCSARQRKHVSKGSSAPR